MRLGQKIKAGALQFVLFIGAVIAILLMAFMLLSHTHSHFDKKTDLLVAVIKSADFGLEASLDKTIALGNTVQVQNENEVDINITVKRELWGIFEKRTATAAQGSIQQHKIALIGGRPEQDMPALYLADHERPVIIAGNSKITGTAFLPEKGIKMGNIYGNSYHRKELLYGRRMTSSAHLPRPGTEMQRQVELLTRPHFVPQGELMPRLPEKVLKNSFGAPTIIIRDRVLRLRDIHMAGNIIVSASEKIVVEATAHLQDVILLAPKIVIKDWTKGYFQAIASESIFVGKKCQLAYPTALVVNKRPAPKQGDGAAAQPNFNRLPTLFVDSYSQIGGVVAVFEKTEEKQYTPQIKIDDHAKVYGEVYSTKNLELKGRVNGSVTTDAFIALENGSVYQNHLYNGWINGTLLPSSYTGLLLAERENNKKVMKWLY